MVDGEKYERWLYALESGEDERWRDLEDKTTDESENSRKATKGDYGVNWPVVQSPEYRKSIEGITNDQKVIDSIMTRISWSLSNRDGKNTEELYAVSLTNRIRREVARIADQNIPFGIKRTRSFTAKLNNADNKKESILLIHNHPRGMPPSIGDINALAVNKNVAGITIGHDGSIYYYTRPQKIITQKDFELAVSRYTRYSEITATEKALDDLSMSHGFKVIKLN